jgi:MFS transporter, Spinster family, sphingosine-1-phosphate transporter
MTEKPYSLTAYQLRLLVVLVLINFVNFAARQVFVPLIPLLRVHLSVSDADLGAMQTWLLLVLALASVPFGFFADRISRKAIIWIGILCWSLATLAGGLASTFTSFLIARAFVGLGEAAYAPAAQSMISGAFPKERRAMAQSIFATGMLLGGACGQVLGGMVGSHYGWQMAFFIVGIAGLIPSLALFSIQEPSRGPRSEVVPIPSLFRIPAFMAMIAAGACVTFASVSLLTWGVDFVESYKDFSLREASVALSVAALVSAITGVLAGGAAADFLQKRFSYGRVAAMAGALLLAAPFLLLAIQTEEKETVLLGLVVSGFFMAWYLGPATAVIHDMMPRRAHATSVGVYLLVTQLVGGLGPQVVGRISDLHDLQLGLQICVAVMVCGGLLMLLVIHFIRRDGLRHPSLDVFHAESAD